MPLVFQLRWAFSGRGPGAVFRLPPWDPGRPGCRFHGAAAPRARGQRDSGVPLETAAGGLELERPHLLAGDVGAMDAEAYGLKASGTRSTSS